MGLSNDEQRIRRLENMMYKTTGKAPADTSSPYPPRTLSLTEKQSYTDSGKTENSVYITWEVPAGDDPVYKYVLQINGGIEIVLDRNTFSYTAKPFNTGELVTVSLKARYIQGDSKSVVSQIKIKGNADAPPPLTNLNATGGFRTITVSWDTPGVSSGYDHADVWESLTGDNLETAERIAQAYGTEYVRTNCGMLETRWYWVQAVDKDGNKSDFAGPVDAVTNPAEEVEIPDFSINGSKLIPSLSSKISESTHSENAIAEIRNALSQDKALGTKATAQEAIVLDANREATKRLKLELDGARYEEVAQVVKGPNGLVAQNYIKTDVNGHIAGYGLYNDGKTSEFAVLANHFFVARPDEKGATPVFEVDGQTGDVKLLGNLIANGSITGEMINARSRINIAEGGSIVAGKGAIFQLGSGAISIDSETGRITVRDPNNLATGDYVQMDTGDITTYKYLGGSYRPMKSLRAMYIGTATSGEPTTIPVIFPSDPRIILSIANTPIYNPAFQSSKQFAKATILSQPYNASTGVKQFTPKISLTTEGGTTPIILSKNNWGAYVPEGDAKNEKNAWSGTLRVMPENTSLSIGISQLHIEMLVYAQAGSGYNMNNDAWIGYGYTLSAILTVNGVDYPVGNSVTYYVLADNMTRGLCRDENADAIRYAISGTISIPRTEIGSKVGLKIKVQSHSGWSGSAWWDGTSECESHVWAKITRFTQTGASSDIDSSGTVTYLAISE